MKNLLNAQIKNIAAASIVFSGLAAGSAVAETGTAHVSVLKALTVNETQTVEFNKVVSQDGTCTMASGGALSGGCA